MFLSVLFVFPVKEGSQGFKTETGCFMTENDHNLSLFLTGSVQLELDSFSLSWYTNSPRPNAAGELYD